jgi:hypothetical protein
MKLLLIFTLCFNSIFCVQPSKEELQREAEKKKEDSFDEFTRGTLALAYSVYRLYRGDIHGFAMAILGAGWQFKDAVSDFKAACRLYEQLREMEEEMEEEDDEDE